MKVDLLDRPASPNACMYPSSNICVSPEEMSRYSPIIPEAITNTVEIAKRCNVELTLGEHYLPDFRWPMGMTLTNFL